MFSPRSFFLTLSLSLLAACSSAPQASDPVEDLAALADANGDLEAVVQIQSVGSSALQSQAETVHLFLRATYNGKPVQGFSWGMDGGGWQQRVSAALAAGDQMRIRGRVRKVGNVSAFVGVMRSQTSGASAAAVTPPTPVILVGEGKTLSGTQSGYKVTFEDVLVSSYAIEIDGQMAGWFRTPDGKVASYRVTSAREAGSGLATGIVFQAKFSGNFEAVQTPLGMMVQGIGQLKVEGRQPLSIIAVLIGL